MKNLEQAKVEVVDKLKMAKEIYSKSSKTMSSGLDEKMNGLADQKKRFLRKTLDLVGSDLDTDEMKLDKRLKVELEKLGMDVDNAIIRMNDGEALAFCIKREEELQMAYQDIIHEGEFGKQLRDTMKDQWDASVRATRELKEIRESYSFK